MSPQFLRNQLQLQREGELDTQQVKYFLIQFWNMVPQTLFVLVSVNFIYFEDFLCNLSA